MNIDKYSIELDSQNSQFRIIGNISKLNKKNKSLILFLKKYLNAIINSENILIPFNNEDKETIIKKISDSFNRYNLEFNETNEVRNSLDNYFQEEENFNNFSLKAKKIRNNEVESNEFLNFVEILKENMSRRLYSLQLLSAYHLAFSQNACNFSVPGAGKTSIVYGAYSYLKSQKKVDKILIVGPLSSFGPWENEYEECFGKKTKSKRLSGEISLEEKKQYFYKLNKAEITLISYQSLPSVLDELKYFLKNNNVMVVLDEAHKIKNIDGGIIAESSLEIAKYSKSRVILTGTPLPNGYHDLTNLYKFIWPNKDLINFHTFQLKEMSKNIRDKRVPELIKNITPFFIRIKKSDLGLPEPIENEPIKVKMGKVQEEIYSYIEKKYLNYISEGSLSSNFKKSLVKARIIRLMQVSTNPSLLLKPLDQYFIENGVDNSNFIDDSEIINKIKNYEKLEVPEKFKKAKDIVEKIITKEGKVIIWCIFIDNIDQLSNYLEKNGIKVKKLDGRTPINSENDNEIFESREKIINEFHKKDSDFKVIIANPFAVSESISLHKACKNAIYVERTFNASNFIQSKDRIHRYGLKKNEIINYYYLTSDETIDETIDKRLKFKEKRMKDILEKEEIPLFSNVNFEDDSDDNDIKQIIKDYVARNK